MEATSKVSERMKGVNPSAVREIFKYLSDPEVISFAGGNPSEQTFPAQELSRLSEGMFAGMTSVFLQYGVTEGYAPLRQATLARMREKYGVGGENDDIIITTGATQGVDLCMKTFTNPGDVIICENPSFVGSLNDMRSLQTRIVGVPMDGEGMDMAALEKALQTEKNVKLIYTIPSFQNPTGVTMTAQRRQQLYELAVKYDVLVIEDEAYFELCYNGSAPRCIKSMDTTGHVIFLGSYSKTISPGLRCGYLIMDKGLMSKVVVAKQCADVNTTVYSQMLISEFITKSDYDGHIARCCDVYREKRDRMLSGIRANFDPRVKYTVPDGGLFIWCTMPEGFSGKELCAKAIEAKVACVPGSAFDTAEDPQSSCFRLNFSMPTLEQIDEGTRRVGKAISEMLSGR